VNTTDGPAAGGSTQERRRRRASGEQGGHGLAGETAEHDEPALRAALATPALTFSDELNFSLLPFAPFATAVVDGGFPHTAAWRWHSDAAGIDAVLGQALATSSGPQRRAAFLDLELELGEPALAFVCLSHTEVLARAASRRRELLADVEAWLRERLPQAEPTEDVRVPVMFWADSYGYSRTMEVACWKDVCHNYPSAAAAELEPLLEGSYRPDATGRLLLWHGPPGTGKTSALRAVAWSWRGWCDVHFVTDPEHLLGDAGYLLDVLLADDEQGERWRLLVLEDTGELMTADAGERTGQGLSRLLNVVDGLIGQGLRLLVLVTTNEVVSSLHEAVTRPGRCASRIEFPAFPAAEADAWLRSEGLPPVGRPLTLAELYALRSGGEPAARRRPVGFVSES
jgi:SpoVK/Ycf46/Vps4 family AAA+-type ATPase